LIKQFYWHEEDNVDLDTKKVYDTRVKKTVAMAANALQGNMLGEKIPVHLNHH
jgi:hypothetical protein